LPLTDQSRIVAAKNQVSCDLAGEAAILNLNNGRHYGLDSVGARIWSLVQEPKTFSELCAAMLAEYDVEPAQLESDLRALLHQLAENELIAVTA
jgi:hypothetical protein